MNGFLLVDKPAGPSSFDVVKKLRQMLRQRRIGHSGTLDPAASGLLVIAVGNATALLPYLTLSPKHYPFTIQLGSTTDTLDSEGVVTRTGLPHPDPDLLHTVIQGFCGESMQVPPAFSAVKIGGRRSYALAREGTPVAAAPRQIYIQSLTIGQYCSQTGVVECQVVCSRGTYIRSLARDIALGCGTVGYATAIRRLAIGPFTIAEAIALDGVSAMSPPRLAGFASVWQNRKTFCATAEQCAHLAHGRDVSTDPAQYTSGEIVLGLTETGEPAAILQAREQGILHPQRVFL